MRAVIIVIIIVVRIAVIVVIVVSIVNSFLAKPIYAIPLVIHCPYIFLVVVHYTKYVNKFVVQKKMSISLSIRLSI